MLKIKLKIKVPVKCDRCNEPAIPRLLQLWIDIVGHSKGYRCPECIQASWREESNKINSVKV